MGQVWHARGDDRSLRGFLHAIRNSPGFWLRVASIVFFAGALGLTKGLRIMVEAIVIGLAIGLLIGYPLFRKWGRVP